MSDFVEADERAGLQLRQPGATVSAATADQELVADELATALGEDRRKAGETCARTYGLLLAEGHLTRERFGSILRMIAALPLPDG